MSTQQLEAALRAKAADVKNDLASAYHKFDDILTTELPKWAAVAQTVDSDPLVAAAMSAVLPTPLRASLGAMIARLAEDEEIKAAVTAEHAQAAAAAAPASSPTGEVPETPAAPVDGQEAASEPAPVV